MPDLKKFTTDDIILTLCDSVTYVLSQATKSDVKFTPMIQKITKTALRPDIGTFVLFSGSFSGLVVINFPKSTALDIYKNYMVSMGLNENELAVNHTSDEVSNSLGELMNQILGNFTGKISQKLHSTIRQSQPKMLVLPQVVQIGISIALDHPKMRRVTFYTSDNHVFYVDIAIDDTEFTAAREIEESHELTPDEILEQYKNL